MEKIPRLMPCAFEVEDFLIRLNVSHETFSKLILSYSK